MRMIDFIGVNLLLSLVLVLAGYLGVRLVRQVVCENSAKLDYDIVCKKSQRNLEIGLVRKWDVA